MRIISVPTKSTISAVPAVGGAVDTRPPSPDPSIIHGKRRCAECGEFFPKDYFDGSASRLVCWDCSLPQGKWGGRGRR